MREERGKSTINNPQSAIGIFLGLALPFQRVLTVEAPPVGPTD